MTFQIGDQVHTASGKPYRIQSFSHNARQGQMAYLKPLQPGPHRKHTHAAVGSLTLIRTAQLARAFGLAHAADLDGLQPWQRAVLLRQAAQCLTAAEHRNDDSRAALNLGTDRLLDLEEVKAS